MSFPAAHISQTAHLVHLRRAQKTTRPFMPTQSLYPTHTAYYIRALVRCFRVGWLFVLAVQGAVRQRRRR